MLCALAHDIPQKQPSSILFWPALATMTVPVPSSYKWMVTICSVVGTVYVDFKNGTIVFTVERLLQTVLQTFLACFCAI